MTTFVSVTLDSTSAWRLRQLKRLMEPKKKKKKKKAIISICRDAMQPKAFRKGYGYG